MGKKLNFLVFILITAISFSTAALDIGYDESKLLSVDIVPNDFNINIHQGNLTNFTTLQDTPGSFAASGGLCVRVNAGETDLEFGTCSTGINNNTGGWTLNISNLIVSVSLQSNDWSNVSVTESQISDLSHTTDTFFQHNQDLNTTNNVAFQNLTLGQTITFALGEIIDNIVNGLIRINANLNVSGGNVTALYYFGDGSQLTGISATADGNASSICSGNQVLLGNGTCQPNTQFFDNVDTFDLVNQEVNTTSNVTFARINATDWSNVSGHTADTDTNASTECAGAQVLLGNGTCQPVSQYFDDTDTFDLVNQEVNTTSNVTFVNVSADFYFGDGSQLSNLPSGNDGNASSICSGNQVLLGNGTCQPVSQYFDDTDTFDLVNQEVNTTSNVTFVNVTASFYFGDGSQLSNLPSTTDGNASSICASDQVLLGNGTCQPSSQYFDNTDTGNSTAQIRAAVNASIRYDFTSNSSDYWDTLDTYNVSQFEQSGNLLHLIDSWLTTFLDNWLTTKDTDDLSETTTNRYDNQSWNQSFSNTLYAPNTTRGVQLLINNTMVLFSRIFSLDWTNATITESQVSDLSHIIDTSASVNCSGGQAFLGNGTCQPVSQYFDNVDTFDLVNQEVNTTSNPQFANITLSSNLSISGSIFYSNGTYLIWD